MNTQTRRTGTLPVAAGGTVSLGGELTVNRLGFGAMRLTGEGIWGPPKDRAGAIAVLRRAVELGVNFIDTADSYGPNVSEELIAWRPIPRILLSRLRVDGTALARTSGPTMPAQRTCGKRWKAA